MAACPALAASRARTAAWRPARASSARSALRVTNGSRVRMMQVLSPRIKYYETLSYLPPLSDFEIEKQLQYITRNNWSPCIEFDAMSGGSITRQNNASPGYYDGRYWAMWKLPLFGCTDPSQVMEEIAECKAKHPEAYIRIIGFDADRQVQVVSFVVAKPDPDANGHHRRQEAPEAQSSFDLGHSESHYESRSDFGRSESHYDSPVDFGRSESSYESSYSHTDYTPSDAGTAHSAPESVSDEHEFSWPYGTPEKVELAGTFNDWTPEPMHQEGDAWVLRKKLEPGKYSFKYVIDGWDWLLDQSAPVEHDGYTDNNVVEISEPPPSYTPSNYPPQSEQPRFQDYVGSSSHGQGNREVQFAWPYGAKTVELAGSFNDWSPEPMNKEGDGWYLKKSLAPGKHSFKYVIDEVNWFIDLAEPHESDGSTVHNVIEIE